MVTVIDTGRQPLDGDRSTDSKFADYDIGQQPRYGDRPTGNEFPDCDTEQLASSSRVRLLQYMSAIFKTPE